MRVELGRKPKSIVLTQSVSSVEMVHMCAVALAHHTSPKIRLLSNVVSDICVATEMHLTHSLICAQTSKNEFLQ